MKILFIADVVRKLGIEAVRILLPKLMTEHLIDLVIANGENIDGGGLTPDTAETLLMPVRLPIFSAWMISLDFRSPGRN